jgi:hypothetical protein
MDLFRTDKFTILDDHPITIFVLEDFVDPNVFARLTETFPKGDSLPGEWTDLGGKRYMQENSPEFADFMEKHDLWRRFYNEFKKPHFLKVFNEIFSRHTTRDDIEGNWIISQKRAWPKLLRSIGMRGEGAPVSVRLEFSSMRGDHFLPPHTDSPDKLISLMLYFPEAKIADDPDAGTEFYAVKPGKAEFSGWRAGMKSQDMDEFFESYELIRKLPFSANKLYGFIKSDRSWHGIRRLSIDAGIERRSLNINYSTR